jgi:hypothetical protein
MEQHHTKKIITSVIQHIFFTATRNSKLVTARRSMLQLVMSHECTHPRVKSCIALTKYFNHYICINIYIFHLNTKFKARHSPSRPVAARHATQMYIHIHVLSHVIRRQKNSIITSVTLHIFYRITKFKTHHSTSCHIAARHSARMYTHPLFKSCEMPTRNFHHLICNKHIFLLQYEIQSSSQPVAARCSSSRHTNAHIHVSSHILWRQKISIITSVSISIYIFFTAIRNLKLVTTRRGASQLGMSHECTHPVSSHVMWRQKKFKH